MNSELVRGNLVRSLAPDPFARGAETWDGWSRWLGPADGYGIRGAEDAVREPAKVDFAKAVLEIDVHFDQGSVSIWGEEKLRRARAGNTQQLGICAFLTLHQEFDLLMRRDGDLSLFVLNQLRTAGKISHVVNFLGTVLFSPTRGRSVLQLYSSGSHYWHPSCKSLGERWYERDGSIALQVDRSLPSDDAFPF